MDIEVTYDNNEFENRVNHAIAQGWIPVGGVSVRCDYNGRFVFRQAMAPGTMITQYRVVQEIGDSGKLERSVNSRITDGWKPIGGVAGAVYSDGEFSFYQAMLRETTTTRYRLAMAFDDASGILGSISTLRREGWRQLGDVLTLRHPSGWAGYYQAMVADS